jgi:hypothetical protein
MTDEPVTYGIHASATIALEGASQKAEGGEFRNDIRWKSVILEMFANARQDTIVDQSGNCVPDHLLVFGQQIPYGIQIQWIEPARRRIGFSC